MNPGSSEDAELEDLRRAIAPLRFPMLLASTTWGSLVLISFGTTSHVLIRTGGGEYPRSLVPFAILAMHGLALLPIQFILRAAVAGFGARTDPTRLVELARLHRSAWRWGVGIGSLGLAFVLLLLLRVC